jgi:hypothetical protein
MQDNAKFLIFLYADLANGVGKRLERVGVA